MRGCHEWSHHIAAETQAESTSRRDAAAPPTKLLCRSSDYETLSSSAALARGDEVVRTKYTTQAAQTSQAEEALAKLREREAAILKQMADIYKSMTKGEKAAK